MLPRIVVASVVEFARNRVLPKLISEIADIAVGAVLSRLTCQHEPLRWTTRYSDGAKTEHKHIMWYQDWEGEPVEFTKQPKAIEIGAGRWVPSAEINVCKKCKLIYFEAP